MRKPAAATMAGRVSTPWQFVLLLQAAQDRDRRLDGRLADENLGSDARAPRLFDVLRYSSSVVRRCMQFAARARLSMLPASIALALPAPTIV